MLEISLVLVNWQASKSAQIFSLGGVTTWIVKPDQTGDLAPA